MNSDDHKQALPSGYQLQDYRISGNRPPEAVDRQEVMEAGQPDPLVPAVEVGAGRYRPALLSCIDAALALLPKDRPQRVRPFQDQLIALDQPS